MLDNTNTADFVFWAGDLNYRIDLPRGAVIDLIADAHWDVLQANDQLAREMLAGMCPLPLRGGVALSVKGGGKVSVFCSLAMAGMHRILALAITLLHSLTHSLTHSLAHTLTRHTRHTHTSLTHTRARARAHTHRCQATPLWGSWRSCPSSRQPTGTSAGRGSTPSSQRSRASRRGPTGWCGAAFRTAPATWS